MFDRLAINRPGVAMIMRSTGIVPVHDMRQDLKSEFGVFIQQIGPDAGVRPAIGGDEVVVH
jgi:hypothetical protein